VTAILGVISCYWYILCGRASVHIRCFLQLTWHLILSGLDLGLTVSWPR